MVVKEAIICSGNEVQVKVLVVVRTRERGLLINLGGIAQGSKRN